MYHPKDRILGRLLAIEEMTDVSGARNAEGDTGQAPSVTKPWIDTNRLIDTIDVPDVPAMPMATKPAIDTNPLTDYKEP